jgi:hypothetical protein
MWTTGNSIYIKLVFQFHPYTLQKNKLSFYTNKLSHKTVCKMHKWMAQNMDPLQMSSNSVNKFVSLIWIYKITEYPLLFAWCHHFPDASKSLQPNVHIRFKTLIVVILCLKVQMYYPVWLLHTKFPKVSRSFLFTLNNQLNTSIYYSIWKVSNFSHVNSIAFHFCITVPLPTAELCSPFPSL